MTYVNMASLYDQLMSDAPYDDWVRFTEKIFSKANKQVNEIIDLGCGTGVITTKLAKKGYKMHGVDRSSEMLAHGAEKATRERVQINWVEQDITQLTGFSNIDVAISYCDVINYVTSETDLEQTFKQVFQVLKNGGLFLFDVHAVWYVESQLINHTFTDVSEDVAYIWDCFPGANRGEMFHELTFFTKQSEQMYGRFDEEHHQQTYDIDIYKKLLKDSGFANIKIYSDFATEIEKQPINTERIFIVAEKR